MAQAYYSPISIAAAQVPSTQTDFPVLVSQTDARFKTIANSGHVSNANGYDIRPYSDSALTTAITGYYLHRYNATTGEVIMRVKVGSLSSSTTPIYLGYGDTGITTDGSSSTCFSNSYLGFYALSDGTTLSVASQTGSNNGTNTNTVTATAGQVDGAGGFASASNQYIDLGTGINPNEITLAAWVKGTSFPAAYNSVVVREQSGTNVAGLWVKSNGKLTCLIGATGGIGVKSYDGTGSHTLSTATWYYLTLTYGNTPGLVGYVNAASDGTATGGATLVVSPNASTYIGQEPVTGGRPWNGVLDEVRIASVARSANWITTEYNNESAPGTFETLGTEVAVSAASTGNMFLVM